MEVWKPVVGLESLYEVSDLGRVRSLTRVTRGRGGKPRTHQGRLLTPRPHQFGYPMITMSANGRAIHATVHRLIMEAFVGPRPEGAHVCHKDGDPANSVLANLRYDTPAGNAADKITHGTYLSGESIYCSKLTDQVVENMRVRRATGESLKTIAATFGVAETTVHHIVTGAKWKNAPGPITAVRRVVRRLSDSERQDALDQFAAGISQAAIARCFGVSVTQISNLLKGVK